MDLHYWWCGNCGNSYLTKPTRCVNFDAKLWGRYPSECEKYPMNEAVIKNVKSVREYSTDIAIGLVKTDGTHEDIGFSGDDAWERRDDFIKLIKGEKA